MKNNIIFDLDGTLTESGTGIKNSVRYTLEHYGLPMEDDESLNRYVGPPLVNS
ncbi:MAG: HAD hydrolase-like protein, partial [Clostridia bacterium]|nr:HAD hydrolase-like protein [Clostridia bacterium]